MARAEGEPESQHRQHQADRQDDAGTHHPDAQRALGPVSEYGAVSGEARLEPLILPHERVRTGRRLVKQARRGPSAGWRHHCLTAAQEGRTSRPLLRGYPVQDPRPGQSPQHHQLKGEIRLPSVKGLRKPVLSSRLVPAERALGIEELALQRQVNQLHALNPLSEEQNG